MIIRSNPMSLVDQMSIEQVNGRETKRRDMSSPGRTLKRGANVSSTGGDRGVTTRRMHGGIVDHSTCYQHHVIPPDNLRSPRPQQPRNQLTSAKFLHARGVCHPAELRFRHHPRAQSVVEKRSHSRFRKHPG